MAIAYGLVWRSSSFSGSGATAWRPRCGPPTGALWDSKNPETVKVLPRTGLTALLWHVAG
jgi:hypothetical protein